ncbi:hypothetical protein P7C70_g3622, partial [Phenoliferia sp. Uapishka_3]
MSSPTPDLNNLKHTTEDRLTPPPAKQMRTTDFKSSPVASSSSAGATRRQALEIIVDFLVKHDQYWSRINNDFIIRTSNSYLQEPNGERNAPLLLVGTVINNKLEKTGKVSFKRDNGDESQPTGWLLDVGPPSSVTTYFKDNLANLKKVAKDKLKAVGSIEKSKNAAVIYAGGDGGRVRLFRDYSAFEDKELVHFPTVFDCRRSSPDTFKFAPRMIGSDIAVGALVACTFMMKAWKVGKNSGIRFDLNVVRLLGDELEEIPAEVPTGAIDL